MIAVIVFAVMIGLMSLNVPIAICTGLASVAGILYTENIPVMVMVMVQRMLTGIDSFTLIAIPLFVLTGRFMALGGITKDLINVARVLVGYMKGGLAYINIVASMLFAGITGSAAADTSSIGGILIPVMIKKGFDKDFSVAVTATSSTIGVMIPPSIPMVVYGVASGASIGQLFLGGIVPGILTGVALMVVSAILSKKNNYPSDARIGFKASVILLIKGIPASLTIIIILGGITLGIFTPTEAAGIAAVYSFLLGWLYYRELKLKDIPKMIGDVATTVGQVVLMISTASVLAWIFAQQGVPSLIANWITSITTNKILLLLIINVVLLFVGTWLDLSPAVIILGGIYSGIFTPTESAVVAVLYSILVGMFIHREIKPKDILPVLAQSGRMTAIVVVILGFSIGFLRYLTIARIPQGIAEVLVFYGGGNVYILSFYCSHLFVVHLWLLKL